MAFLATANEVYINVEYVRTVWVTVSGAVMINDGDADYLYMQFETRAEASLCALDLVQSIGSDVMFFSKDTFDNQCANVDRILEYNEKLNAIHIANEIRRTEPEKDKV